MELFLFKLKLQQYLQPYNLRYVLGTVYKWHSQTGGIDYHGIVSGTKLPN